ncbi:MAG TPA: hypothetical protein VGE17_07105 [Methylophilus sp.]
MSRFLMSVCLVAGLAFASSPVLAKHEHTNTNNSGGQSAEHMSAEGTENTNGASAAERDKGQARAEDRASDQGQSKHHGEPRKHDKSGQDKKQ